jgi:hypothetical protein
MKILLLLVACLCLQSLSAQTNPLDSLLRIKWVARTEIGYNLFMGDDASRLKNTVRDLGSIKFNYVIQRRLYAGPAYIAPGFGLAISEWRFDKNLLLTPDSSDRLLITEDSTKGRTYGKSKLQIISFRIPVEVGLQIQNVNIAVGGYADILLGGKHKRKFEDEIVGLDGKKYTQEVRAITDDRTDLRLRDFYFGVYARLAYRGVGLYAQYQLNTVFRSDPQVYAFQAGIAFSKTVKTSRKKGNWMDILKPRSKNT